MPKLDEVDLPELDVCNEDKDQSLFLEKLPC